MAHKVVELSEEHIRTLLNALHTHAAHVSAAHESNTAVDLLTADQWADPGSAATELEQVEQLRMLLAQ
ncbi:hypothetical protein [Actinomyces vulturis]|uniref:hypothetical protein n=1 Tax=Actinomyces vulturis TaxID=1857645 RepID=UPI00082DE3B4|nr:hypothetical protein [Actinomyces vulturis]